MKKIFLIPFFAMLISLCACEKMLDKEPYEMYEGDFVLNTVEGMNVLLTGTYDLMGARHYYGGTLLLYEAVKGPEFFTRAVTGGSSFVVENRYDESARTNSNARLSWTAIYLVIRNATILIENVDNVVGDPEELRRIKGEAYAIRGLGYFNLMRLFAYPPIFSVTSGSKYQPEFKWGVPIVNTVEKGTNIFQHEIRRETADSTYKFIVDQFQRAGRLLEGRTVAKGFTGAPAVKALLMRAHLYLEQWDDVIALGEEWLEQYGSSYSMIPYDAYTSSYYKPFNSESIWELGYTSEDNMGTASLNYFVRRPTWNEPGSERDGKVSQNVGYSKLGLTWDDENSGIKTRGLEFLTYYASDVRNYLVCDLGLESNPEYKTVRKYIGDPNHGVHNIPVVRLPEVYLSIAEAYAMKGDFAKATTYASMVSQPRRKADVSVTGKEGVLDERRRELILEGHTYWDYFRTARNLANRQIIECVNDRAITFGALTGTVSYKAVYPIPLSEMNSNPAIRDQQNHGYAEWTYAIEDN